MLGGTADVLSVRIAGLLPAKSQAAATSISGCVVKDDMGLPFFRCVRTYE
jgi:hypothetical protein